MWVPAGGGVGGAQNVKEWSVTYRCLLTHSLSIILFAQGS